MLKFLSVGKVSVSDTVPRRYSPFLSVLFPLSIRSSKFSNEVLHTKFDLQYSDKQMFN